MPFRERFDCLWCGTPWTTRGRDDLEGWAQLCPACLGKAGSNAFLRGRLRAGIAARAGSSAGGPPKGRAAAERAPTPIPAAFPDDWFLRRGPFERGAIHDAAWAAELDVVTRWLDDLPLAGRIDEPAAGVGFVSPLLASKGVLHAADPDGDALDRARSGCWPTDSWRTSTPPTRGRSRPTARPTPSSPRSVGRVRGAGRHGRRSLRRRLRAGGGSRWSTGRTRPAGHRRDALTWHDPDLVAAAVVRAGFGDVRRTETGRFFRLLSAEAGSGRPMLSSGAMSPREPHDRDRRLRRHGRGHDRRRCAASS
jgi:hypothetical protein